jgi:hypothetical protein
MINSWLETLLELDFEVIHRPGVLNVLPDALSRVYDTCVPNSNTNPTLKKVRFDPDPSVIQEQTPPVDKGNVLELLHLEGPFGTKKMLDTLLDSGYFWIHMKKNLEEIVHNCIECQKFNIGQSGYHPLTNITALLPLDH